MTKRTASMPGSASRKPRPAGAGKGRNRKLIPSLPGSPARWVGCFTFVALVLLGTLPAPLSGYDAHVEEIIRNPTVAYQKAFEVDTTPEIWNRVLDNLHLMGRLWGVYRFQPAYQVTRTDSGLHVVDPTGIVGDVQQVGRSDLSRCYYGRGQFNHWAIPSFFTADGVILFECTTDKNNRLLGEVKIFMQGNNWISRTAMDLFSGILTRRVDNRFTSNMGDMKKIIRDVAEEPDRVRNGLAGQLREDFDKAFPIRETKRARE